VGPSACAPKSCARRTRRRARRSSRIRCPDRWWCDKNLLVRHALHHHGWVPRRPEPRCRRRLHYRSSRSLQHTVAHFTTLQHTLQHTATHCNTLQHAATYCNTTPTPPHKQVTKMMQHTATHCNTPQHTATHNNMLQHTTTRHLRHRSSMSLQHTAT